MRTHDSHIALEKEFVKRLKTIRTREDYIVFLWILYVYYESLEKEIENYFDSLSIPQKERRRKAQKILEDIQALSSETAHINSASPKLPVIRNVHQTIGVLYVMEGSTLGGKIIAPMLRKNLNLSDAAGLSFFNAYGHDTDLMWHQFQEFIDQPAYYQQAEEIFTAANETFKTLQNWIEENANHQL